MRIFGFCFKLIGGLVIASLVAVFFGWFVEQLWNWLMPTLFHLPTVTFWQAAGLVLLSRILVGHGGGHHKHHHGPRGKGWGKWGRRRDGIPHCDCRSGSSAFAPGGDIHNWEYFDEWWKQGGEERFETFVGHGNRGWGWWKWWKAEGREQFESWLKPRLDSRS